jgi:hypothetical protein
MGFLKGSIKPATQGPMANRTFFKQYKYSNKNNNLENKVFLTWQPTEILQGSPAIVHNRNTKAFKGAQMHGCQGQNSTVGQNAKRPAKARRFLCSDELT